MTQPQIESAHWLVRMNHRNRSLCFMLLGATMASHMADIGYGPLAWGLLVLQFLVYPQLAFWWARRASDAKRAELRNVALDTVCFGLWAAALHFPLWISFILLVGATLNPTAFHGLRGLLQSVVLTTAGAGLGVLVWGLQIAPPTNLPTTLLCIASVLTFILIVATEAYARASTLRARGEMLKRGEAQLREQLASVNSMQIELQEQAQRDGLTGLYNRRYMDATLARELSRCEREAKPASLLMVDIDHFKLVNDRYGHAAGDAVLKNMAALLAAQVRTADIVCRFGGEEFLVLLPGLAPELAMHKAEQLRAEFAALRTQVDGQAIAATLSVGVAAFPRDAKLATELLRVTDQALYRAKHQGRNQVAGAEQTGLDL